MGFKTAPEKHQLSPQRWQRWDRELEKSREPKSFSASLTKEGWMPISSAPEGKPIQLLLKGGMAGHYESAGAYILKDDYWYIADPETLMHVPDAVAWRPWTKADLRAQPQPSRGRRG